MRPDGIAIKTLLWRTFTPTILVLAVALGALVYTRLYDAILDGFSRKLVTTSALTGALIDPADHDWLMQAALVRAPSDLVEAGDRYRRNAGPMRRIRRELDLTYLYTQAFGGTQDIVYVVDATEGDDHSPLGAEDELTDETRDGLRRAMAGGPVYVSPIEFQEQWGLLKTAAAPVYGADGRITATAGADVNISVIEVATQNALFASALIGAASLIASALVTLLIVRWVAVPIESVKADALRIAAGDRTPPAERAAPREVRRLRAALAERAAALTSEMREAWRETLAADRERNAQVLKARLEAGPVVLLEGPERRVVWTTTDDSVAARLERAGMVLLAARLGADPQLAARWRDLAEPVHGVLRLEAAA